MENRKDIGKAFNEKLSSLDKQPNKQIWQNIHSQLIKKKRKKLIFFVISWDILTVSFLGLMAMYCLLPPHNDAKDLLKNIEVFQETTKILIHNKKTTKPKNGNIINNLRQFPYNKNTYLNIKPIPKRESKKNTNHKIIKRSSTIVVLKSRQPTKSLRKKKTQILHFKKPEHNKKLNPKNENKKVNYITREACVSHTNYNLIATKYLKNEELSNINKEETNVQITDFKKEKNKIIAIFKKDSIQKNIFTIFKKIDLDIYLSPTYHNYFSNKSQLDERLNSISNSTDITISYGVRVGLDFDKKISMRIGFGITNLNLTKKGVALNTPNYSGIDYLQNLSNQSLYTSSNNEKKMDITQKISYIEMPIEVRYKFNDKKLGMQAIGGFSFLHLQSNIILANIDMNVNQEIGKTANLPRVALSLNLGIGINYNILKNTKLFIEPMFKYQINNSFNTRYNPFYTGISTGIQYSIDKN